VLFEEPPELLALELRSTLEQLGEMVGAVYTDDLLDRIFSRFCIGK
jgi:tRNA modification GTPase